MSGPPPDPRPLVHSTPAASAATFAGDSPSDPDRHLRVDAVRADLRGRTIRSGFIQLASQVVLLVLTTGSTMVLARLLLPADYGLMAMVMPLLLLAGTFRDLGLPMATVQREDLDHGQVSALFWLALRINTAIVLVVAALSPAVAWFYGETRLLRLTLAMAGSVFVLGIGAQHASLLMRQMRFGSLAAIEVAATIAGSATAIGAALLGAGYWSLALQQVAYGLTRTAGVWRACGWRPGWGAARRVRMTREVRSLLSFGVHYAGFQLLGQAARSLDSVLVGYFTGAASLGLYANAAKWAKTPLQNIFPPLAGVAVSGLSRRQNDPAGYRAACRAGFLPVLAVVMPVLAFMAVEAHDVIRVLLGERWLGAVPILRILCIGYFVGSMGRLTTMLLLSQGDTKRQFRWALLYAPVLAVAVGIGVQWGPVGAAVGVAAATWVLSSPRLVFSLETSPISPRELLGIAARPALASIGAGAVLLAAGWLLPDGGAPVTRLGLAALVFGLAYALAWTVSPGNRRAAREALGLFRELWRRKKDRRAASGVIGSASEIAGAAVLD